MNRKFDSNFKRTVSVVSLCVLIGVSNSTEVSGKTSLLEQQSLLFKETELLSGKNFRKLNVANKINPVLSTHSEFDKPLELGSNSISFEKGWNKYSFTPSISGSYTFKLDFDEHIEEMEEILYTIILIADVDDMGEVFAENQNYSTLSVKLIANKQYYLFIMNPKIPNWRASLDISKEINEYDYIYNCNNQLIYIKNSNNVIVRKFEYDNNGNLKKSYTP
ncbi:hypothetical protein [Paenibacillus riograndensis]|uniref:Uncharacterized protein n=1 Tax=Paenibacillus riograndensis SBR5 TaxID=1073571 RepID=A0A0E3WHK1_9BACL|nr:hypothetical protein [Paenibacillus riograndensis]CQR55428.1 hypothetical protein PRIO_3025 [Paenibacillus riograndensis SBR5]